MTPSALHAIVAVVAACVSHVVCCMQCALRTLHVVCCDCLIGGCTAPRCYGVATPAHLEPNVMNAMSRQATRCTSHPDFVPHDSMLSEKPASRVRFTMKNACTPKPPSKRAVQPRLGSARLGSAVASGSAAKRRQGFCFCFCFYCLVNDIHRVPLIQVPSNVQRTALNR
jgi:hypothetical protein